MSGKLFRGDISNSVVELNLLEGDAGSLSYGLHRGATNYGEIRVIHKGDITSSSGFQAFVSTIDGLVIGTSCTSIGDYAFNQNTAGKAFYSGSLVIPNSVTSIGSGAFYHCVDFTGDLVIPDSVTSIGSYAFMNPYQVYLNPSSFDGVLVIPNSVTSIGSSAFYGCNNLTALYTNTPASSWVGSSALYDTTALVNIYYGPDANGGTGYTSTFQEGAGMTVQPWTNYPDIP